MDFYNNDIDLTDFEIVYESDKAYLLKYNKNKFWMPKSAFADTDELEPWAYNMLMEKLEV